MSKIVITGATGHVGNVLVRSLLERGARVRVLLLPNETTEPVDGLNVERVTGDVRDQRSLLRAFEGADVVYHLAGVIEISETVNRLLQEVNVEGTKHVIEACRVAKVRRLVYTSSVHAFTEPPAGGVLDERAKFDPALAVGAYGKSKAAASAAVEQAARDGLDAVLVCPTGVIGPYDYLLSELGHFFVGFSRGKFPAVVDGGYDFVDVRDVANAHILAAERGRKGESYLFSGGRISIKEMMGILSRVMGRKAPRVVIPLPVARVLARCADVYYQFSSAKPLLTSYAIHAISCQYRISDDKARRELGYTSMPVQESIVDAVKWLQKRGLIASAASTRTSVANAG